MSVQYTYTCDQCGQVKGQTNHWFAVHEFWPDLDMPTLKLRAFLDRKDGDKHLCGEVCVMARVSMCMQEILEKSDKKEKARKASNWIAEMHKSKFNDEE